MYSRQVKTYPNPFTEYVTISFALQNKANVKLFVFDKNGQLVAQIRNSAASKGNYKLQWNGTNSAGAQVKNGNYKIKLIAGDIKNTSSVMLKR